MSSFSKRYVHYVKSKLGLVKTVDTFSKHRFLAFFDECRKQERLRMFWAKYIFDSYILIEIGSKLCTLHVF